MYEQDPAATLCKSLLQKNCINQVCNLSATGPKGPGINLSVQVFPNTFGSLNCCAGIENVGASMRVLIVDRYFWPDTTSHAVFLKAIGGWLSEDNHDVTVLTAQPSYKPEVRVPRQPWSDTVNGCEVRRVWLFPERKRGILTIVNHLLFITRVFLYLILGRKYDVVWSQSTPPVFQALCVALCARIRGSKFVYHIHDVHPEAAIASGILKPGIFTKLMLRLDIFSLNTAACVVPLSKDMTNALKCRPGVKARFEEINNFAIFGDDTDLVLNSSQGIRTEKSHTGKKGRPARFVFAGNIGRFQNLGKLVEGFAYVDPEIATLDFLGEGTEKKKLQRIVADRSITGVRFLDHQPPQKAFETMQGYDFGVISLLPGFIQYAYPSKTATYLAANLRLFGIFESDSELSGMIEDLNIGDVVSPALANEEIGRRIEALAVRADSLGEPGVVARRFFDPAVTRKQWLDLFTRLGKWGDDQ